MGKVFVSEPIDVDLSRTPPLGHPLGHSTLAFEMPPQVLPDTPSERHTGSGKFRAQGKNIPEGVGSDDQTDRQRGAPRLGRGALATQSKACVLPLFRPDRAEALALLVALTVRRTGTARRRMPLRKRTCGLARRLHGRHLGEAMAVAR